MSDSLLPRPRPAVANLSYLTDYQWPADHQVVTAGLDTLVSALSSQFLRIFPVSGPWHKWFPRSQKPQIFA